LVDIAEQDMKNSWLE